MEHVALVKIKLQCCPAKNDCVCKLMSFAPFGEVSCNADVRVGIQAVPVLLLVHRPAPFYWENALSWDPLQALDRSCFHVCRRVVAQLQQPFKDYECEGLAERSGPPCDVTCMAATTHLCSTDRVKLTTSSSNHSSSSS